MGPQTRGKLQKRKEHNKKKRKREKKTHREMIPVFSGPERTTEHLDPVVEDDEDDQTIAHDGTRFLERFRDDLDSDSDEEQ